MMTAHWPLRYPSGQKRSKVHSLCSLWLICHLDFRPEEHLDNNLNTKIMETEYRERRLEDCDTRSFKTFGSVDISSVALRISAFEVPLWSKPDSVIRDRMRLINPKSGQLGPLHLCLLEESEGKHELFLSARDWVLSLDVNRLQNT